MRYRYTVPKWLDFSEYQDRFVRRNFFANTMDGALFAFGLKFVSLVTVLPILVQKLGGTNVAVGMIPVLWNTGFNLPQIFIANTARRQPYKKPFVLKTALIQRIPWLVLAALCFFRFDEINTLPGLILFFSGLTIAAVGGSLNMPGWFDLINKVTPVRLRGRLFAFRTILGAILGILAGWVIKIVLDTMNFPKNFALLFLLAFIVMMGSYIFLALVREEEPNAPKQILRNREFFRILPKILKNNSNFTSYLVADALIMVAVMANAFYTVHALKTFSLAESYAGTFTIVMTVSMIAGNVLFGYLADQYGHRLNLIIAAGSTAVACLIALVAPAVELYYLAFIGSAFTISLIQISRLTIIAELSGESERTTYVALTNLITAPFVFSGIFGGWLADSFGYDTIFYVAGGFALLAVLWLFIMVQEPRSNPPAPAIAEL